MNKTDLITIAQEMADYLENIVRNAIAYTKNKGAVPETQAVVIRWKKANRVSVGSIQDRYATMEAAGHALADHLSGIISTTQEMVGIPDVLTDAQVILMKWRTATNSQKEAA